MGRGPSVHPGLHQAPLKRLIWSNTLIFQMGRLRPRKGNDLPKMHRPSTWASHLCSGLPPRDVGKVTKCSPGHEREHGRLRCHGQEEGPGLSLWLQNSPVSGGHVCQRDQVMTGSQCATEEPVLFYSGGCSGPESSCDLWGESGLPAGKHPRSQVYARGPSPQLPGEPLRSPQPCGLRLTLVNAVLQSGSETRPRKELAGLTGGGDGGRTEKSHWRQHARRGGGEGHGKPRTRTRTGHGHWGPSLGRLPTVPGHPGPTAPQSLCQDRRVQVCANTCLHGGRCHHDHQE